MKYAAERAAAMEKRSFPVTAAILGGLAAAPLVTRGINWLSGYDPKKQVKAKPKPKKRPRNPLKLSRFARMMMPHGGPSLLGAAHGLHEHRAGE